MPDNLQLEYMWVLWLAPLPILLYLLLPAMKHKSASLVLSNLNNIEKVTKQKAKKSADVKRRNFISFLIFIPVWLSIILTLSSPVLVGEPEKVIKTSRSFLIVVDISHSMAETDWKIDGKRVTRWQAVKHVMKDFVEKRKGDRMGLIVFGSSAYIQAPFTPDLNTVQKLIDDTEVGMAGQMTHIGKAIVKGIELFNRDTMSTKVMLVLTDGIDVGTDILPVDAAQLAKEDSILIYTIGIGDPNQRFSGLDEKTLQHVSQITNAKYFRAQNTNSLDKVYETLNELEPIEYEEDSYIPKTKLYHYPLAFAVILTLIGIFIEVVYKLIRSAMSK